MEIHPTLMTQQVQTKAVCSTKKVCPYAQKKRVRDSYNRIHCSKYHSTTRVIPLIMRWRTIPCCSSDPCGWHRPRTQSSGVRLSQSLAWTRDGSSSRSLRMAAFWWGRCGWPWSSSVCPSQQGWRQQVAAASHQKEEALGSWLGTSPVLSTDFGEGVGFLSFSFTFFFWPYRFLLLTRI